MPELERPDRVRGVHVQGSVARNSRRPCVAGDLLSDDSRPRGDELRHARGRTEAPELALDVVPDPLDHAGATSLVPAWARVTSSLCAGSTGSAEALVAVISA